jgi:hypothetical protein
MTKKILSLSLLLGCFLPVLSHAQCSPFMGVGNVQFLDNTAKPLQSGVLYVFQAGTSTQQATFTSSSCGTVNTNPITFGVGARASIWLTTSALYKFVLCAQNDGSACSAGDVLFSVDQVPGGSSGGGSSGSPFVGVFISGSSNPATSGAIRLASGDLACFRNAANSGNLCISKDSNDLLTWQGGSIKLPESNTPTAITGVDILEADVNGHRFFQCSNGIVCTQIVNAGVDINTSDQVTQLHFGSTATPLNPIAPTTGQFLKWDGTNISGASPPESVLSWGAAFPSTVACPSNATSNSCLQIILTQPHTLIRVTYSVDNLGSGCSVQEVLTFRDVTLSTNLFTSTVTATAGTLVDSGVLSVPMTAGDTFLLGILTAPSGCGVNPVVHGLTAVYQ